MVRAVACSTDPYQRHTGSVGGIVASQVPGAAQSLPVRLDALGRPLPNDRSPIGALGISKGSTERHDPIVDLAAQYNAPIGYPPHSYHLDGEAHQFTPAEYNRYLQLRGQEIREAFTVVPKLPAFQRATAAERTAMLKDALREAGGYALNAFKQLKEQQTPGGQRPVER